MIRRATSTILPKSNKTWLKKKCLHTQNYGSTTIHKLSSKHILVQAQFIFHTISQLTPYSLSGKHLLLDAGKIQGANRKNMLWQAVSAPIHLICVEEFFSPVFRDVLFALQEADTWVTKRQVTVCSLTLSWKIIQLVEGKQV